MNKGLKACLYIGGAAVGAILLTSTCADASLNAMSMSKSNYISTEDKANIVVAEANNEDNANLDEPEDKIYSNEDALDNRDVSAYLGVQTPSSLEKIALEKNPNLKINNNGETKYSVYKDIVHGVFIYNPILSDDENDGNLDMKALRYWGHYRIDPDNEENVESPKLLERVLDEDGNPLYMTLNEIFEFADTDSGQLAIYFPELMEVNDYDRDQQNILMMYDPDDSNWLIRECLNRGNGSVWRLEDEARYGVGNDSYYIIPKDRMPPSTSIDEYVPPADGNGGNGSDKGNGYTPPENGNGGNGSNGDNEIHDNGGDGDNGDNGGDNGNDDNGNNGKKKGNCGHGNDSDGFDEQNPGKGKGKGPSGHGNVKDDGPPPGHDPEKPGNGPK